MKSVYLLQHVHELPNGVEDVKVIGVFKTESDAEKMIDFLSDKVGFSSASQGFSVDKYELNKGFWLDGFEEV